MYFNVVEWEWSSKIVYYYLFNSKSKQIIKLAKKSQRLDFYL